jgi:predicted TIM-barrel fold metal-dependent hydrolase
MIQLMRVFLSITILLITHTATEAQTIPLVDYHQHLISPETVALTHNANPTAPRFDPIEAKDLITLLDRAGIRRALVLSVAYMWANPSLHIENEYEKVRAMNDWTSRQVAEYPDRLRGFCGVNPIRPWALEEIARCARDPQLHYGLKLHFGNSAVDVDNPEHVTSLKAVFRAANRNRMAIVVHMHASFSLRLPYGRREAEVFLNELLPEAPDVPVQIAHLAGGGSYDDTAADEALQVFIDAVGRHDPRMKHVYFDLSGAVGFDLNMPVDKAKAVAGRVRKLGIGRVLFGTDTSTPENFTPRQAWIALHQLPLTDAEFRTIAHNIAPYMRGPRP